MGIKSKVKGLKGRDLYVLNHADSPNKQDLFKVILLSSEYLVFRIQLFTLILDEILSFSILVTSCLI